MSTTPLPQKRPVAPIFIVDSVSLAVSREKDGKLRLVYAGWDDFKALLLATLPPAEADCGPFMTSGPDPLWVIYGEPSTPWLCNSSEMEARFRPQVTSCRTIVMLDPMAR